MFRKMAGVRKASVPAIALLVVTLAAGFFGGAAWQRSQTASVQSDEDEAEPRRDRSERRMVIDELGLQPDKRTEVEEIIQHFMVRMRALYGEYEPMRVRVRELNDEYEQAYRPKQRELFRLTRDSIKSILAPEQRVLYDSLLAVRYGNRNRDRDGSGEGRDRGGPDSGRER